MILCVTVSKMTTSDGELYCGMFLDCFLEHSTFKGFLFKLKEIADKNNINYTDIIVYCEFL